ncbi:7-alpha-hydroxysteroid dehydrogenase [Sulfitobacter sp. THAF37]|uniref:short-chain dehydrogenase/reductase n=1 Tax=Sulfitobacter sp. THAF37 TaxID=2587855 RepID=UPI001267FC9E|nr:short-chain dehydrogenase/reductase [Sulfitobacter sp. THAF37]QFT59494.1 7-alpha-hydroxysteroid dehydrogenase [Sulfitobacter sp. THAF37]
MDLELTGKHVLVTGASKGIGLETARVFAAEGARVTLVSRRAEALEAAVQQVKGQTGGAVDYIAADLSDDRARADLFDAAPDIDILVNNAGAIRSGPLSDRTMDDWRTGFELKVWGYIHLCMLYAPRMRARGAGTIINVIGMGGRAVRSSYIIGAAGNAALIGFTNALGAETPQDNVRVFGINPSATLTDRMTDRLRAAAKDRLGDENRWEELLDPDRFPFGRPAQAQEIASLAVLLASAKVHYLSGTVVDIDGGGQWAG